MRIDIKGAIIQNNDKWIYDWFRMDATCPRDVQNSMDKANGQTLEVYLNSGGGDIFAGSEIYTALRSYAGGVTIHVVGLAASAASVILCAGESDITPTGMVMVHNVSGVAAGDYHAMDQSSEILQKANRAMAAAYQEKTGREEAEILSMMDRESWMIASEAVGCGLVDRIVGESVKLTAAYGLEVIPQSVIEKIRNTVKHPQNQADFLMQKKALAELAYLELGGKYE